MLILPRRSLIVPSRHRQRGYFLNSFAFGSGTSDPNFASVVALLHFDGTNGSTTITDQIGTTWIAQGNAQISTAQSKFGGASCAFDGTGDVISGPNTTLFDFNTGDFTMEGWFYLASTSGTQQIFAGDNNAATSIFFNAGVPTIGRKNVATDLAASSSLTVNTWTHVAWSRAAGTLRVFIGGTSAGSVSAGTIIYSTSTSPCYIGCANTTTFAFPYNGYMDDLRITKGVGRYTANFTPPTAAFPNS